LTGPAPENSRAYTAIVGKQGGESTKARFFAGTNDFLHWEPGMDHARLTPLICSHSATVAPWSKLTFLAAARRDFWFILSWLRIYVRSGTKVVESWRFEIPSSSTGIFFTS
jgi:hypothetical protein